MPDTIDPLAGAGTGTTNNSALAGTNAATTTTTTTNVAPVSPISMSYQTSESSLPDWYTAGAHTTTDEYINQLANLPTGGYTGATTAGLTADQLAAIGQAGGYLTTAQPLYNAGAGYQTQGAGLYNTAATNTAAASQYDPAAMQQHLNPYTTGALNELARLSTEQLNQKILPEVQSSFVGAGQFGGTRNAEFTQRALANQQRELLGAQAGLLNNAYNNAAEDYRQWGQLGIQGGQALGQLGQGLGTLGQNLGQYGTSGVKTGMELSGLQQAQTQREYDAARTQWEQGYTFPLAQFGALGQAYNAATGHITPTQRSRQYQF